MLSVLLSSPFSDFEKVRSLTKFSNRRVSAMPSSSSDESDEEPTVEEMRKELLATGEALVRCNKELGETKQNLAEKEESLAQVRAKLAEKNEVVQELEKILKEKSDAFDQLFEAADSLAKVTAQSLEHTKKIVDETSGNVLVRHVNHMMHHTNTVPFLQCSKTSFLLSAI